MRTKRTILAIALILLAGTALLATAQAPAPPMKIKVTAEQANLREKPDIGSGIVQQIPEGTILEADKKEGEWFFVRYALEDGGIIGGYIHESLVEVVEGVIPPAETKPAEKLKPREARPKEPKPGRIRIGRIEPPDFSTGSIPLDISFSAGIGTVAPRDLNDGARGYANWYGGNLSLVPARNADALHIAPLAGFEVTYRLSPRVAIGLGADYMRGANGDGVDYTSEAAAETVKTRPAARAVPVKLIARFTPGAGLYIRGGLGIYTIKASYLYRIDGADSWQQSKGTATANGLGAEAAFGGEWEVAPKASVFVEAGFRIARFEKLTGKDVFTSSRGANATEVGTLYYFTKEALDGKTYPLLFIRGTVPDEDGVVDVRQAVINLSGTAIRAGVRYRF
jgi:opacity protein-like surface antigen